MKQPSESHSFQYPATPGSDTLQPEGMPFSVVCLRNAGVRLSRAEFDSAEPVSGLLIIEDWREGHSSKRALRQALLKDPQGKAHPYLLLPLFDPQIVRVDAKGMVMTGFEIHTVGDRCAEYSQVWLMRPILSVA